MARYQDRVVCGLILDDDSGSDVFAGLSRLISLFRSSDATVLCRLMYLNRTFVAIRRNDINMCVLLATV